MTTLIHKKKATKKKKYFRLYFSTNLTSCCCLFVCSFFCVFVFHLQPVNIRFFSRENIIDFISIQYDGFEQ